MERKSGSMAILKVRENFEAPKYEAESQGVLQCMPDVGPEQWQGRNSGNDVHKVPNENSSPAGLFGLF